MALRRKVWRELDPGARDQPGLSWLNKLIVFIILISVLTALLGTEESLTLGVERYWQIWNGLVIAIFAVEYTCRIWVCVENPAYGPGWRGRLRYARSAVALIDLGILVLTIIFSVGAEAYIARLARLMRILQLARLGRYSRSLEVLTTALSRRSAELQLSVVVAVMLLIISSTLLYVVEGGHQPENFGSIPRTMWWSVATLTTVGYGDVVPITPLGRIFAAMTAIFGIGLIAMPAGILAAAFSEALEEQRRREKSE